MAGGDIYNFLDDIFSTPVGSDSAARVAEACLRRAANGLSSAHDPLRRSLGGALAGASIKTSSPGEGSVLASIAVQGAKLNLVRSHAELVQAELAGQFEHEGWKLTGLRTRAGRR